MGLNHGQRLCTLTESVTPEHVTYPLFIHYAKYSTFKTITTKLKEKCSQLLTYTAQGNRTSRSQVEAVPPTQSYKKNYPSSGISPRQ